MWVCGYVCMCVVVGRGGGIIAYFDEEYYWRIGTLPNVLPDLNYYTNEAQSFKKLYLCA